MRLRRAEHLSALAPGRVLAWDGPRGPRPAPLQPADGFVGPADFRKWGFDPDRYLEPMVSLHELADAYVWIGAPDDGLVITADGQIVLEPSFFTGVVLAGAYPADIDTGEVVQRWDSLFLAFDGRWRNHFHWICAVLPLAFGGAREIGETPIGLPPISDLSEGRAGETSGANRLASLRHLGLDHPTAELRPGLHHVRRLQMVGVRPNGSPAALGPSPQPQPGRIMFPEGSPTDLIETGPFREAHRSLSMRIAADAGRPRRRIYLARGEGVETRIPAGAGAAIEGVLARHGFERVVMERLAFEAQVRTTAEAAIVVGVHGAGLANIAFMQPGGLLAELCIRFPGERRPRSFFYQIASCMGVRYAGVLVDEPARNPAALLDRLLEAETGAA